MKRKPVNMRGLVAMLSVALVIASVGSVAQAARARSLSTFVSATYQRAFYETLSLMDGIASNLEKLLLSEDSYEQELLSDIARQADGAQSNLSVLPESLSTGSGAIKFTNQTGDFCESLAQRLAAGGVRTDEDAETLNRLYETCVSLRGQLEEAGRRMQSGELWLDAGAQPAYATPLSLEETQTAVEYPVLLYDGPFSDGRKATLTALQGEEIDRDEAVERAMRFIGEERVRDIAVTGQSDLPAPLFELEAQTDDGTLALAVTRTGGQVLYMLAEAAPGRAANTPGACIDEAARFLESRGFAGMEVRYWTENDDMVTVNFAATQDGVLLYPDLIKVQVSMGSGRVVGWEARNYLANHTARENLTPALSAEEARERLGDYLNAQGGRLCVIPLEHGETLAYEFSVSMAGADYLVYLDANTGRQRNIYRILDDESGHLAI